MKIKALPNQTLLDIAVQEYGSAESVFLLAKENKLAPNEKLEVGMGIKVPDMVFNREMESYCKDNLVSPATAESTSSDIRLRIFTEEFTEEFM